jgi:hypothetical protein
MIIERSCEVDIGFDFSLFIKVAYFCLFAFTIADLIFPLMTLFSSALISSMSPLNPVAISLSISCASLSDSELSLLSGAVSGISGIGGRSAAPRFIFTWQPISITPGGLYLKTIIW